MSFLCIHSYDVTLGPRLTPLGLTPEGLEEFYKIVNAAHESPADADLEKRCCSGVCCDYSNCVTGVAPCIYNCANIPNAGGVAGCIAGCYVECG
ncbi:hypothetical protein HFD88_009996 [Aspergillus terreus]|nr:hypothetical protein HFD88_009996 [Aspergillus terreus]